MRLLQAGGGCLCNLANDTSGNTLAIIAASVLPMMALIGGGVDISRSYMAKTQLQSACDAGVLAGRRAMSKTGEYGDDEKAKADAMFNFNFNSGLLSATGVSYDTDDNDDGQVTGTATATVPTLVMKIFDRDQVNLEVNCMAELQIGNADVMFVLDTTGSMKCSPEDNRTNCTPLLPTDTNSRIVGLRDAVKDFHKTINQAVNDNRTRIRYGFVPYSQTVNVSELIANGDISLDSFVDQNRYQVRRARFATPDNKTAVAVPVVNDQEYYTNSSGTRLKISASDCTNYGENKFPSSSGKKIVESTAPAPADFVRITYSYGGRVGTGTTRECFRNRKIERTTYPTKYTFTNWRYEPMTVDVSSYKTGDSIPIATGFSSTTKVNTAGTYSMLQLAAMEGSTASGVTTTNTQWTGCIEERTTSDVTSFDPIPDAAYDLDLDDKPNGDSTSWRPQWAAIEHDRDDYNFQEYYWKPGSEFFYKTAALTGSRVTPAGSSTSNCPSPMSLFQTVELDPDPTVIPGWLDTYLANLTPAGNTYLDIGMLWGGRLTSPTGLFKDNVNRDDDKISVSKHIVFMTDGVMQPSPDVYSAYGIENLDSRIAPKGSANTIAARHYSRFSAMCEAVKAKGVTIWVVAFSKGSTMTTELQNCATGGRAYYSDNTEALRSTFRFIAAQVADLRLGS